MERKIGEIFEYNGEWHQCVKGNGCEKCIFNKKKCYTFISDDDPIGYCEADKREDKQDVIFKKLEKVGEPFTCYIHGYEKLVWMQEYKLYDVNFCKENALLMYVSDYKHKRIAIEIKQTKENMKEKKQKLDKLVDDYMACRIQYAEFDKGIKALYDKEESEPTLKEFDLEEAKSGKPVCTRGGRNARIICFDRRLFYKNVSYPILALVERSDGEDDVCGYNEKGKVLIEDGAEYKDDLMMLPEKKEGWVNVYKERCYESKEEAIRHIAPGTHYIDTIRVEWEDKE